MPDTPLTPPGDPRRDNDWYEQRTQVTVRAILALGLVGAYVAMIVAGLQIPEGFELLVGAGAGFFLGANPMRR